MAFSLCGRKLILSRTNFRKIPKRNGYIVLVPEIGEDLPGKNPLLKEDKIPEFNKITIEKCIAAIGRQTIEFEEVIKNLEVKLENKETATDLFNDVLDPLEETSIALDVTWGMAKTLYFGNQSLMPTKCYLNIHDRAKRASASKYISLPIYKACRDTVSNKEIKLTDQQRRVLTKFVLEGRLNGLELSEKKLSKVMYLSHLVMRKSTEFKEKLEISTKQFAHTITNADVVRDFPEDFLKITAADSSQPTVGPWTVTLHSAIVKSFLEYCPDRSMRWKVWDADVTRSSLLQDKLLQTSSALEEIRDARREQAEVLGYKTYAHLSMETKMAGSLENVYCTLDRLLETARPAQERELKELNEFANERGLDGTIKLWDIPYWSRKQQKSVYNYDEESLKNYFPLPKVLSGLSALIEALFSVKIVESKKADVWHKDVRFFDVFDMKKSSTEPIANFYLDPYARGDDKIRLEQDSGSIVTIRNKSKVNDAIPLCALIFNFASPVCERPSLLSFRDVRILFQKFGHMLQHLLTTVEYSEISGLSFVEWDAVFISDYFLEHWLYEPSVLRQISSHHDTGECLTAETIETLRSVRSHLAGYNLCKELYLSRFDLELHSSREFWMDIMKRVWSKHFVIPLHKRDSHACQFESIFGANWAAAFYSNLWSEMIAADLYSAFQEISATDKQQQQQKEIGSRYRETFLSLGGSLPASEIFRKFRGRDPSPKALLKNLGLYTKRSTTEHAD